MSTLFLICLCPYCYCVLITPRLSQLNLKLQLDSLAAELKGLSLAQHDYLRTSTSMFLPGISATANKTVSTVIKTTTDTCVLLDSYAQRLCSARAKIAVVGNILESTQVFSVHITKTIENWLSISLKNKIR